LRAGRRLQYARARGAVLVALAMSGIGCGGGERDVGAGGSAAPAVASPAASAAPTDSLAPMAMQPGMTSALPQSPANALGAFRLAGNEPFWAVRVTADGLTYSSTDYEKGIHFAGVAPERDGDKLRWVAITPSPDAHTLDVTVEEERCQDSMADKTWSHTAHVIFDGTRLEGCAERLSK
jgi:uncharacterized membrane protein